MCGGAFRSLRVCHFRLWWCEVLTSLYFARGDTVPPLAMLNVSPRLQQCLQIR